MPTQFDPPSGTRDFLAAEVEARERAFAVIRSVFSRYGFEPLQTPAFERLDVLLGKYGEEGDKLIFKILRRGEHEASGEADLALRYDMTVPLARVASAYGSQLPTPYKRYAMGPVWRADRPGRGRFREFVQCDLDTLGTTSVLADAEVICAVHDTLAELGVPDFRFLLNSRHVLAGLLEAFGVPGDLGPGVLITLDKLDKLSAADVAAELTGRGLASGTAGDLVAAMTAPDAEERIRAALKPSEEGSAGLDEVDEVLSLVTAQIPGERIAFTPRLVRGLSYYTGPIWEVVADGVPGSISSGGRYDHLIEQLGGPDVPGTGGSLGIERILLLLPDGWPGGPRRAAGCGRDRPGPGTRNPELLAGRRGAPGRAAGQRLYGLVGEAGPPAQVGQRPGRPLGAHLRPPGGRSRRGHRAGHGQRRAGRGAGRRAARIPGRAGRDGGLDRRGIHRRAPPGGRAENLGQVAFHPAEHVLDSGRLAELGRQAGHPGVPDAARHEPAEPVQVAVAVQGEAVHGHAPRHPDPDRGDLALRLAGYPYPAASLDPGGGDPGVRAGPHQRFLDGPHVGDHVDWLAEPDDRVPDELAGPMPGDLAAPVHLHHRRPGVTQRPVERAGPLPGREYRLVLQQEARIRDLVLHPLPVNLALQFPAAQVGNGLLAEAEMHVDQLVSHAAHDIRGPGGQLPASPRPSPGKSTGAVVGSITARGVVSA